MSCFNRRYGYLFLFLGFIFFFGTLPNNKTFASYPDMVGYYERRLQQSGYQTNTTEGIIAAVKSKSSFERHIALELLTIRNPQEAVTILKQSLDDKAITVRCASAHLLGVLNDKSGLERMQKDFEELVPKEEEPNDPNILRDKREMEQWTRKHRYRITTALEIGKVLAELGDFRAYDLAAKEGLTSEHELGYLRLRAAETLGEMGKKDFSELKIQGKDPIEILCKMAETEKERAIFTRVRTAANGIGGKAEVQILEKAVTNPHQAEEDIRIAGGILNRAKWKMQANKRTISEPNNSPEPNSSTK